MDYEDQFEPEPEPYCLGAEMQEEERARERLKRRLEKGGETVKSEIERLGLENLAIGIFEEGNINKIYGITNALCSIHEVSKYLYASLEFEFLAKILLIKNSNTKGL